MRRRNTRLVNKKSKTKTKMPLTSANNGSRTKSTKGVHNRITAQLVLGAVLPDCRETGPVVATSAEEAQDFASQVLASRLLVVHDAARGGHDDEAELAAGQQTGRPLLQVGDGHVEARADHAALVEAAAKLHHDFPGAVVVDDLELLDVAVLHHDGEEAHDDLAARPDQHLALAAFFGVVDAAQGISEYVHVNHGYYTHGLDNLACYVP